MVRIEDDFSGGGINRKVGIYTRDTAEWADVPLSEVGVCLNVGVCGGDFSKFLSMANFKRSCSILGDGDTGGRASLQEA